MKPFQLFLAFMTISVVGLSQISYTTDCGSTSGWTFEDLSRKYYASAGCGGGSNHYSFWDNLWSSTGDGSMSRQFTSSNGNEVTLTFNFSAHEYSSSSATPTADYDVLLQYSTNNSSWSTVATMSKSSSSSCQSKTLTHTPASGTVYYKILVDWISGDFDVEIDDISFQQSTGPSISTSGTFSTFTSCVGSVSAEQSFTVSGSSLDANISISAPTGYEVSSTSGSGFGSSLTLTENSGTINSTTVYTRLKSDASNGASGNVSISSTNATSVDIATGTGTVAALPTVNAGSDVAYSAGGSISFDATTTSTAGGTSTQVFSEDFGSGSLPTNWSNTGGGDTWSLRSSDPGYGTSTDNTAGGDNGMAWHDNSGTGNAIMYTGALDLSSYASASLTMYIYSEEGSKSTLDINVSTDGGSNYTNDVCTYNGNYTSWTQVTCDLSSYLGNNVKIQFHANDIGNGGSDYNNDLGIDDVVLTGTTGAVYAWTTNASNGNTNWSATNTEDITVTSSATISHAGDYTLTVTDAYGCSASDIVSVTASPTIETTGTLSAFSACSGANSSNQSFSLVGISMDAGVTITPPSGYEVSTTSGFSSNVGTSSSAITVGSSGNISSTTIYVRTTTSASNGDGGNIALSSTNATTVNVATGSATITGTTFYVDDSGNNSNNGLTSGSPFLTLEYALTQAVCGVSTINVAAGTYTDDLIDLTSSNDGLTIAGAGNASTIFDQSGSGDHFMEIKSSATNITIKDLKIKDYDENNNGGAIDITTSGTVTIQDCHFDGNSTTTSYDEGAAISTVSATTTIKRCVFSNNSTSNNTSVSVVYTEGGMTMENCLFYDNSAASTSYSGIVKIDDGTNTITNCTFTENSGGDVVYIWDGNTTYIRNCLFYNNTGSYDVEEGNTYSNYPIMLNCYYEGRTGSYSTGSESGNLTSGTVGFTDAASNDFSIGGSSVCVDAGTDTGAPTDDINGVTRSSTDIGCYEYQLPEWTGGAGTTDWTTGANWNTGTSPSSGQDIIIPSTSTDPVITGAVSAGSLTIQAGGELTVSGSGSLALSGNVTISGTMNYTSSGSITLSKSGGTLSGTGSQTGADYVLSNGASFDLSDSWSIDNINVNSGASLTVATTKTLTTGTNLTNGGTLTCSGSAGLTVGGDVSLSGTTVMNSGTLDTDGDFGNSGTFTAGTSTFKLSGSSAQTISNTNVTASIPNAGSNTVTLVSEDFSGSSTGNVTTTVSTSSYYQIVASSSVEVWEIRSSSTSDNGTCSGCSGNRARSDEGTYGNIQNNTFVTKQFSPSTTSLNISFNWSINIWQTNYLKVFLYNETDAAMVGSYIVNESSTDRNSQSTSTAVTLSGTNSVDDNYTLRIQFYGSYDYGCQFDNILITENVAVVPSLTLSNEFYDVVIDNSSGGIDLSTAELGYSNSLTMTSGILSTGTDDTIYIESSSASAMPSGSSSSFINGNVKFAIDENTSTYTIPLGDGTASSDYYRVDFVNNNLQGTKFITARVVSGSPDGYDASALVACNDSSTQAGITAFKLKEISSESHLKLTPSSQPTGGSYGLNIYTENFDKNTWTNNKVAIFKRSEGTTDNCAWSIAGTLPSDNATGRLKTDNYLSFTGATSFSSLGPGGQGGGALPVSLSAFDALLNDEGKVDVSWTTMSEQDNDFFSVQRTADGDTFEEVEEVPSAGNSIVRIDYSVTDEDPLFGTSYYRLMQQDYDGMQTYSDMVAVNNNFIANLTSFSLFYEGNQTINLRYTLGGEAQYNVSVYDISGKIIYSDVLNLAAGTDNTQLNITDLSKGLYFINLSSGQELYSQKIVVH